MLKSLRFSLFWVLPVLPLLVICLVSCSRRTALVPLSTGQVGVETAPNTTPPPLRPNATIHFQKLSLEDGLSQSVVNVILQDSRGFLWFGTQDGLNRYDGYSFKVYKPNSEDPNSLSDGWIESLLEDRDGNIWVGTYQGGLNRYDPSTDTFTQFRHIPEDPFSISKGVVYHVFQDRSGTLWVGTGGGLDKLDPVSGAFIHYRSTPDDPASLSSNNVHVIHQDSTGQMWVGTLGGGMDLFDPATGKFQHFHASSNPRDDAGSIGETPLASTDTISNNYVKDIAEDGKGNLWISTERGLNRFNPDSRQFQHFLTFESSSTLSDNSVSDLLVDKAGTLWVGTERGLNRFDEISGRFTRYFANPIVPDSLSSHTILSLYEDREGVIWIGTWGGGVNKHSPAKDKFTLYRYNPETPEDSIPVEGVFGLVVDPSGIAWIGTAGGGLARFDPASGETTRYTSDPNNPDSLINPKVWAVYRDSADVLWVGTSSGLDQMDEATDRFIHHKFNALHPSGSVRNNFITQIYEGPSGSFWIGTAIGVDFYDRKAEIFTHITDPNDPEGATSERVSAILEDRGGFLWVGTSGSGAYRLDRENGTFRYYRRDPKDPGSLNNDIVLALHQDVRGDIWLGTGGGGLNKYNPQTDSFSTYTERDGLPNNFIYCIIPDERQNLWLTTNFGLSRFDPRAETFENYTTTDGLQSNEFNSNACARSEDGTIYVGGNLGLNLFTPAKIHTGGYIPPVIFTSLTRNEKPIQTASSAEHTREVTLEWPGNSFEFEFAALSFAEPKKNQYAYMLEGFDTDWNQIGNKHEGRYTNLPGGQYILRLKGSNNDGVWNENGAALRITIIPPFWQTWWFFVFAGLVMIAAVWAGYRFRLHSIESRRRELERQVAERTREIERLFEQMKELAIIEERNRLARELHDSAKQKAFAALAQIGAATGLIQRNTSAAQTHISEAENLVHDVIQELTFLIQEMYPMALKEKGLVVTLREYVYEWEGRTDIKTNLLVEGDGQLPLKVEQSLYRITQETLANAARHSHADSVNMMLFYDTDRVSLGIEDDGCGFDPAQKPKGVGLRSIKERAESVGGRFVLESSPGNGTRIEVIIPIVQKTLQGVQP